MSEVLGSNEERAQGFAKRHIFAPADYEAYVEEVASEWRESAQASAQEGRAIIPMWLRRNGDDTTELSAHVDYLIPMEDGAKYLAAIDVSSDGGHPEIQVWLPSSDGSGEPVVATEEGYSMPALARAIEFTESAVENTRTT